MGAQILHTLGLPASSGIKTMPVATRGLVENNRFGEILRKVLAAKDAVKLDLSKVDLSKVDPRILALLQSGMPTSTIVTEISKTLADKVATALSHGAKNMINDLAKNKLVQAFASALAPPGGSPPGSSAEQAATLAQRLKDIVANVARAAEAEAGQQNRFPGKILDANSAKETPAQQQTESPASLDAVVSSFVESVLRDAVAQLEASAGPAQVLTKAPTVLVTPRGADVAQITVKQEPLLTPHTAPALAASIAAQTASAQTGTAMRSDSTPGDILGRMIARAVNADARINAGQANTSKITEAATQPKLVAPASATTQTPASANTHTSLENMVAAIVDAAKNSSGNSGGQSGGENSSSLNWNLAKNLLSQAGDGKIMQSNNGDSFATQANALLSNWNASGSSAVNSAANTAVLAPYTTVDANSIIDQVVKGLTIRNLGDNNSEVRMRLSPENLGDVSVKLSINGGNISASITAQHADVRDTLLANQNQLQKSLADAGLKLANFSVNVSSGGANGFAQQQQLAQQAGIRRVAFHLGNSEETQHDVPSATPTFGPPLVAGWNLGILNYLA